jgi:hypothetical protein
MKGKHDLNSNRNFLHSHYNYKWRMPYSNPYFLNHSFRAQQGTLRDTAVLLRIEVFWNVMLCPASSSQQFKDHSPWSSGSCSRMRMTLFLGLLNPVGRSTMNLRIFRTIQTMTVSHSRQLQSSRYSCSVSHFDALFIFSLFSHYTSTCFRFASSPSSGGNNVHM